VAHGRQGPEGAARAVPRIFAGIFARISSSDTAALEAAAPDTAAPGIAALRMGAPDIAAAHTS
jgi:hypothetical protein